MTLINLSKSNFFLQDLALLKDNIKHLNKIDADLINIVKIIDVILANPVAVSSEHIKNLLEILTSILSSYEISAKDELYQILIRLQEEMELLEASQSIGKTADLIKQINYFYSRA